MDFAAEQSMEMEALESILMDDLEPYEGTTPSGWGDDKQIYKVRIRPLDDQSDDDDDMQPALEMLFAHTPSYPDEPPMFKLRSVRGLSDAEIAQAEALLEEQVQANLGMAMIYTLVGAAQEWIANKATAAPVDEDPEEARKRAEAEEEARRAAARAHGHMVTPELFQEWKRKFNAEQALQKAAIKEDGKDEKAGRLTGKQWFLQGEGVGSEQPAEADGLSEDDELFDDDEDEDFDEDFEEEDDDDMLDEYLASKA